MKPHRIYTMSFASVYPHYVAKAEKKGRTKAEVDEIIHWLTGYDGDGLARMLAAKTNFEDFFARAPALNPARTGVTGLVCGVRVEAVEDPLMREARILDKLIDELARGRKMDKILRTPPPNGA
ncbi:DUF2200 domain-containing protein [Sphingosinicella ginsenosidimutans]|uniref:DUF2200 domain-containing protein n=1 Tax=Allosphingosinicella ginsenosidimutans TaxID=1176539 RepID=A0A5C6TTL0_9SPHN|nr:DUF2200 domain-containing protein [Sphingosinicella ginsenosidimutans]TXC63753.1 DUF2200 domain-containing protein [Sphingosinicella ginsenosidimutans]